ncbi:MAG TPA: dihydropteroate synthase [Pseudonocardiaceae bacterium]|nr:dihydropteroate synthase [Pseudonocardiaceae bacterium]
MTSRAGRAVPTVRFGARRLPADRAAVMAIVTRGTDSCSDRGVTYPDQVAMAAVDRAVHEGADIVDLGAAEDTRRVAPFVAAVRERYPQLAISVDIWRPEVARPLLDAGADILNWADADLALAEVAAERECGVVCRYTGRASWRTRVTGTDVVRDVIDDLTAQAARLVGLGVSREAILIDPTHDVGKDIGCGLELLRRSDDLVATGWPVLITLSTKGFIGVDGILAATAIAAWARIRVFRVHQVRQTRRVLEMVASIAGTRPPARAVRGLTMRGPA